MGKLVDVVDYICHVMDKYSRAKGIGCRSKSVWMTRFDIGHIKNHKTGRLSSQFIQQRPLYYIFVVR